MKLDYGIYTETIIALKEVLTHQNSADGMPELRLQIHLEKPSSKRLTVQQRADGDGTKVMVMVMGTGGVGTGWTRATGRSSPYCQGSIFCFGRWVSRYSLYYFKQ